MPEAAQSVLEDTDPLLKEYCEYMDRIYRNIEVFLKKKDQADNTQKLQVFFDKSVRPFIYWLEERQKSSGAAGTKPATQQNFNQSSRTDQKQSSGSSEAGSSDKERANFVSALAKKHKELDVSNIDKIKLKGKVEPFSRFKEIAAKLEEHGYRREGYFFFYGRKS